MQKEVELRKHRCCFTGHRPEKLTLSESEIKASLESKIRAAIKDGYRTFISGMARGVDLWAADIVLQFRAKGLPIHLICAIPYKGFENRWGTAWRELYRRILTEADFVSYICPRYSPSCFQIRNKWMVDHSARVIAIYNGTCGGTRNTLKYAEAQGVSIII